MSWHRDVFVYRCCANSSFLILLHLGANKDFAKELCTFPPYSISRWLWTAAGRAPICHRRARRANPAQSVCGCSRCYCLRIVELLYTKIQVGAILSCHPKTTSIWADVNCDGDIKEYFDLKISTYQDPLRSTIQVYDYMAWFQPYFDTIISLRRDTRATIYRGRILTP
jgi:hypothetical protein